MARDYDAEHRDLPDRKYAYEFDYILRRYLMRALEPHFAGRRALEMGCYKGEFTKLLLERFAEVSAIEASPELLAAARAATAGRARFLAGTFEEIALAERYDAVFLVHTLEHLDDPRRVLRRVRDWLAEDGRLFLVVPNANAASRQIAVAMGLVAHNAAVTEGERAHGHRRTYALDTLEEEAAAAGLKVVARGGVMFKALANFQFDRALAAGIVDEAYLEGCYRLGMRYPDLCASIYLVCGR
jgi:2-polyprenyl-3-methyl-5-hydroxy-6-metoxy-1,4-benzoquinol methylase